MRSLRYLIVLASLGWFALYWYAYVDDSRHGNHWPWWFVLMPTYLLLNILYVWLSAPQNQRSPSRIARLFSLWLDAKEAELRERAKTKN
jgi:hypothetical protein